MFRYTWGMHMYLRRLWKRRPPRRHELTIELRTNADEARRAFDGIERQLRDPKAPLAYRPEPVDQDAPGWGPAPYR